MNASRGGIIIYTWAPSVNRNMSTEFHPFVAFLFWRSPCEHHVRVHDHLTIQTTTQWFVVTS